MDVWGRRTAAFIGYLFTPEDIGDSAPAAGRHLMPAGRWRGVAKAGLWLAVSIVTALALGQLR